jgi:hypothetical protein
MSEHYGWLSHCRALFTPHSSLVNPADNLSNTGRKLNRIGEGIANSAMSATGSYEMHSLRDYRGLTLLLGIFLAGTLLGCSGSGGSKTTPQAVSSSANSAQVVSPSQAGLLGDLDGDGEPTVGDAIRILRIVVGLDPDDECADANQNGSTDVGDAIMVLRCVVGLDDWPLGECGSDTGSSTISTTSGVDLLPYGLTVENFEVTLNGDKAVVLDAIPARDGGVSICFIFDTTGSMGNAIDGVKESIVEFASEFTDFEKVYWSGMEFGDGTPSDGINTWDFSFPPTEPEYLTEGERTLVQPSQDLNDLNTWLEGLVAIGGGDWPENPLKALMEAKATMNWPEVGARHFITIIDVGAHQRDVPPPDPDEAYPRPDGEPFCPWMGSEVLAAFRGWGIIHAVSPDYSDNWTEGEADGANAPGAAVTPSVVIPEQGWDIRELADGGPPESRTHEGTGGKWTELLFRERVDLNELGILDLIRQSYTIVYRKPVDMTSAHVVITASYIEDGVSKTGTFDLGEVTF